MIWIDNDVGYNTSKATTEYCRYVRLICMDWPAKSLDFNTIENLWQIIKI